MPSLLPVVTGGTVCVRDVGFCTGCEFVDVEFGLLSVIIYAPYIKNTNSAVIKANINISEVVIIKTIFAAFTNFTLKSVSLVMPFWIIESSSILNFSFVSSFRNF